LLKKAKTRYRLKKEGAQGKLGEEDIGPRSVQKKQRMMNSHHAASAATPWEGKVHHIGEGFRE